MKNYNNICASHWGNLGTAGCAWDVNQLNGFIITPESKVYAMASYTTDALFLAALDADALANVKSARIYPYFRVIATADNTGATTVQTTDNGTYQHSELAKPSLQFTLAERGLHQVQSIFKFMGNNGLRMFLSDKRGFLWGQKTATGGFTGFPVDVNPESFKVPVGMNASEKKMNVYFRDEDAWLNEDKLDFFTFDSPTALRDGVSGIHDVKMSLVSAAGNAIVVKVQRLDNLVDLGLENETALKIAGAYLLVLASTGAAVEVSSVTYSSTAGTFTLAGTFTTALHYLSLSGPTTLAALATPFGNGATGGYESNVLNVTPA